MDIDEISSGRMILGLGSGTARMNGEWYSMPFEAPPAARMRDAIGLIKATIGRQKGRGLQYEGPHYKVNNPAYFRPRAARLQIPIYLAGVNPGMIKTAAACADGLIGHPVFTRRYAAETVLPLLAGSSCQLKPYVLASIASTTQQARDEVRAQIAFYYTTRLYHTILKPHGWESAGEAAAEAFRRGDLAAMTRAITDEMIDEIAIAGTVPEVREQIKAWAPLADEVLLCAPSLGLSGARIQENLDALIDTFGG
jgi:alkanesulfonate monooxygenase SsuD/methylene tetrahydromethanopterin reductase-like flavin-dependent oxidoreductase (luciferase family)